MFEWLWGKKNKNNPNSVSLESKKRSFLMAENDNIESNSEASPVNSEIVKEDLNTNISGNEYSNKTFIYENEESGQIRGNNALAQDSIQKISDNENTYSGTADKQREQDEEFLLEKVIGTMNQGLNKINQNLIVLKDAVEKVIEHQEDFFQSYEKFKKETNDYTSTLEAIKNISYKTGESMDKLKQEINISSNPLLPELFTYFNEISKFNNISEEKMILLKRNLLHIFKKQNIGILEIIPFQTIFDNHYHNLNEQISGSGAPEGTVLEVIEDGFYNSLDGEVLLEALVNVAS